MQERVYCGIISRVIIREIFPTASKRLVNQLSHLLYLPLIFDRQIPVCQVSFAFDKSGQERAGFREMSNNYIQLDSFPSEDEHIESVLIGCNDTKVSFQTWNGKALTIIFRTSIRYQKFHHTGFCSYHTDKHNPDLR